MGESGVPFSLFRVADRRVVPQPISLARLTTSFGRVMTNIIISTPVDHVCDLVLLGLSDTTLRVHVFTDNSEVYINNRRLARRGMYTLGSMQLLRVCTVTFLVVRGGLPTDADAVVETLLETPPAEDAAAEEVPEEGGEVGAGTESSVRGSEPHSINQMLRTSSSLRAKENQPSQRRSVLPGVGLDETGDGAEKRGASDGSEDEEDKHNHKKQKAGRKKRHDKTKRSRSESRHHTRRRRRGRSETSSDDEEEEEDDRRRKRRKRDRRAEEDTSESWSEEEERRRRRRGRGRSSSEEEELRPKRRQRKEYGREPGRPKALSRVFRAKVFFFGENERLLERHAATIQARGGKAVLGYPRFPSRGVSAPDDGLFHPEAVVAENRNAFLLVDPHAVGNVLPYLLCFLAQVPVLRADFVSALAADETVSPADFFVHTVPNHPELDLPQPFVFVPHDPPIVNRRPDPVRVQVLFREAEAQQASHAERGSARASIQAAAIDTANTRKWAQTLIVCVGARLVDRPLDRKPNEKPVYNFVPCEPVAVGGLLRRRASLAKQNDVHMDWVVAMLQARQFVHPDTIINAPCDHSEYSAL